MKLNFPKFIMFLILGALAFSFSFNSAFAAQAIKYEAKNNDIKDYISREQKSADKLTEFCNKVNQPTEVLKIYIAVENQVNNDNEIGRIADKTFSRNKITRLFIGPDRDSIKSLNSSLSLSRNRIDQLKAVGTDIEKNQGTDLGAEYSTLVSVLKNNNAALQSLVDKESKSFSFFGWLVK